MASLAAKPQFPANAGSNGRWIIAEDLGRGYDEGHMGMLHTFIEVFIPLLVAIDAVGLLPIYVGMTSHLPPARRRKIGAQAVLTGLLVCVGFMFLGQLIFKVLGITDADFRIAGGILLLVLAVLDLLIVGKPAVHEEELVGIVPLGMPLIAGPAALTTVLVLAGRAEYGYTWTLIGIAANFIVLTAILLLSDTIVRVVRMHTLKALSKLVMVLLAAIAVNFIRTGIAQVIHQGIVAK